MIKEIPDNMKTLKELRVRYGYTQQYVADKIGMSLNNYSKIESNIDSLNKTSIATLVKLANLYKVSKDEIFLG